MASENIKISPYPFAFFYSNCSADCEFYLLKPDLSPVGVTGEPFYCIRIETVSGTFFRPFPVEALETITKTLEGLSSDNNYLRNQGSHKEFETLGWLESILGGRLEDRFQHF